MEADSQPQDSAAPVEAAPDAPVADETVAGAPAADAAPEQSPRDDLADAFRASVEHAPAADPSPAEPIAEATADPAKAEAPAPEAPAETAPVAPEIPEDVLAAAVERAIAARDKQAADAQAAAEREAEAQRVAAERRERLFGKPNELADLLTRRAQANRSGDWSQFTAEDDDRLTALTEKANELPAYMAEAEARVSAEYEEKLANARGVTQSMLDAWAAQIEEVAALSLDGFDGQQARATERLPDIVAQAHKAGAASRDGEVEHLKAQLAEAKASAFGSQPRLETAGGASASGRGRPGLPDDASPRDELAYAFAQQGVGTGKGRS